MSENDRIIRDALADVPELLTQWDESDSGGDADILVDTGGHEAQALIAAVAISVHGMHASGITLPKGVKLPANVRVSETLLNAFRGHLMRLVSHQWLREQFSKKWLDNVVRLKDLIDSC